MAKGFFRHTSNNRADFLLEGEKYYDSYVALIEKAGYSIHLQTYIFDMDAFGERVHAALISAARRGVKVFVLVDGVGAKEFSDENEWALKQAGITFSRFNGIGIKWLYQWGRRLHHKILMIDDQFAIVGGINVTTSGYGKARQTQQLDFAVYLEGPVTSEISSYCQFVFRKSWRGGKIRFYPMQHHVADGSGHRVLLKIGINDWVYNRRQITKTYERLTTDAKDQITIIHSYFFPRKKFMQKLVDAAKRGVKVKIVVPTLSDWPSYILASEYLYRYFMRNGVEVYQWNKSVLHGKMAIVDDRFCTLGSFNLNYTSYQQNLEMNVDILSEDFVRNLNSVVEEMIRVGCRRIEPSEFDSAASLGVKMSRFLFHLTLSVIAGFSVALTYRDVAKSRQRYFKKVKYILTGLSLLASIIGALIPGFTSLPFLIAFLILVTHEIILARNT